MTLNSNDYRINIKTIQHQLDDKTTKERYDSIGPIAVSTGVPIIIVATYVGELYGFTDKLIDFIERLKLFYNVTEVFGGVEV